MTIMLMQPGDYEEIYALWNGMPGIGLRAGDDDKEGIARFLARNPHTCMVARQDGLLVGVVLGGHDGRRGHIYHMAVHPASRRRGVGRALVQALLEAMRREGIRKVGLVAYGANDEGNAFWREMGFAPRGDLVYQDITLAK